jgi:predicted metal-dependent hydrolase
MTEQHRLDYGETTIDYELSYARRKTLEIAVHPDLRVVVKAPQGSDPAQVEGIVRQRAPWILKQQRKLAEYLPQIPPRQYVSGETHYYLGRACRLKVVQGEAEGVTHTRGFLTVQVRDKRDTERVKMLLDQWYRAQAEALFRERLAAMLPRFARFGIAEPGLRIRTMKTRWGSCSSKGSITLNLKLMQVEVDCIDYLIAHELCHLIEMNHSKRFYALMDQMLPDWRERKERLNRAGMG